MTRKSTNEYVACWKLSVNEWQKVALQRDCCCLCTPTPKRGWLCMGRSFVDVPGNGVAFILTFGDDIVFAAVLFDVHRWTIVFAAVFVFAAAKLLVLRRAPARCPSCMYAGRPVGLAVYIESNNFKNVQTNRNWCHKKVVKIFAISPCLHDNNIWISDATTAFETVVPFLRLAMEVAKG